MSSRAGCEWWWRGPSWWRRQCRPEQKARTWRGEGRGGRQRGRELGESSRALD
ncbi:hypothetical protein BCR44DRAFT_1427015 [Catenaria anguillulae PL171]|uniref:Uncharacterized protein n=1 Tax=Catenaria anguillulae PL171 TaxID=765915 RepID=A0A1Y2HWX3_9FUNG|nr:hypothetical protein BCR44DRAFT_1427015 [Catenaria anguillulae PL171]